MNKLIIFDFDGVLVYTEKSTFDFYRKLLPKYGIYLKASDFKYKIGRKSVDFFRDVLGDKFDEKLVEKMFEIIYERMVDVFTNCKVKAEYSCYFMIVAKKN